MKKTILIFSLIFIPFFLSIILNACNPCKDGPINYFLKSTKGVAKRIISFDKSGNSITMNTSAYSLDSAGVRYDSVGLDIHHEIGIATGQHLRGQILEGAYACSPVENYEFVTDIIITSSENYNDTYLKGIDLKDIMHGREGYELNGVDILSFNSTRRIYGGNNFLTFDIPPSKTKIHNFKVVYKFQDRPDIETLFNNVKITQ